MLSIPMHELLRRLLAETSLNQTQFAQKTGIKRRRVSDLLTGRALPKPEELSRLCNLFRAWARRLRGAAKAWPRPARKKGKGRKALPGNVELQRLVPAPRVHLVRQDKRTGKHWYGLTKSHPELTADLKARMRARKDLPDVLQHLDRTRCDSKFELAGWVQFLADEAGLCEISLYRLGFSLHTPVDRDTREQVGHRPKVAYLLKRGETRAVQFPQVSLVVEDGSMYTVDGLVLVLQGRRRVWVVYEVDGSGHRSEWDKQRAEALAMPEVRFTEAEVTSPDFVTRFWKKVARAVGAPTTPLPRQAPPPPPSDGSGSATPGD